MLLRRRLLRLFRLLVALTALLATRPSTAAQAVVDQIVLVAALAAPCESEDDTRTPDARTTASASADDSGVVAALAPRESTRAIRERAYLLHCALLR